jgi:hypothetical protein
LLAPTRRDEWSGSGNNDEDETNGLRNEREREGANAWVVVVVVVLVEREAATAKAATVNFMADDFGCDSIRCFVNEEMSGDGRRDEFSFASCGAASRVGAFLHPLDGAC